MNAFGAEMFNWGCLMNNAYKPEIEKPYPHVHFHFRGRYRKSVKFAGELFVDEEFGHHYDRTKERHVSPAVFDAIRKRILEEIEKN